MKPIASRIRAVSALMFLAAVAASAADFSAWAKKMPVTFAGYAGGATPLTNFPALVVLRPSTPGFSYAEFASPTGGDLRFSSADGITELDYEIDSWNTKGDSFTWVRVPVLTASTKIYAYWGNASATTPPPCTTNGATWSPAAYAGVWHLNEASGTSLADARANGLTADKHSSVAASADGRIGACQDFPPGNRGEKRGYYIRVPDNAKLDLGNTFTVSGWIKYEPNAGQNPGYDRIFSRKSSYNTSDGREITLKDNNDTQTDARGSSGTANAQTIAASIKAGNWIHVAYAFNSTTVTTYSDGQLRGSGSIAQVIDNDLRLVFGNNAAFNEVDFKGKMDEIRLLDAVPSADWIRAEHDTVASNATFATYGTVENVDATLPAIFSLSPAAIQGTLADAVGQLASTGTSAAAVFLHWGTTDGATNIVDWTTTVDLGTLDPGVFTNTLSPLAYGATYHYRHSATNSSGRSWAPLTVTFVTLGPPAFSAWSAVAAPVAVTLSATLASTGAAPTTVSCWFGEAEENLAEVRSWSATAQPQTFRHVQEGLTPGTTYHYAFKAVNTTPDTTTWTVWTPTNSFTTASDYIWDGGGADNKWSTDANWDHDTAPGASDASAKLTFGTPGSAKHVADADAATWTFKRLTFDNLQAPLLLTGGTLIPGSGGISNNNTTAGRAVTVSNDIQLAGSQLLATADNANSVVTLAGDISGSGTLTIAGNQSKNGGIPTVRLDGANSAFVGNIALANNSGGLWLLRPEAMIGGNIDIASNDRNLHLASTAGVYTFGIGNGPGNVRFRAANDGDGLYWSGGRLAWDPGRGGDCILTGNIAVNGDMADDSSGLDFGNSTGILRIAADDLVIRWPRGRPLGEMAILFALGDDGAARRLFLNNGGAYRLTRPSVGDGGSALYVENGATLTLTDSAFLPAGPLRFNNAWLLLEDLAWSSFLAARPLGTGDGRLDLTPGTTFRFAARGTQMIIDGSPDFLAPLSRDLYLGTENRTPGGGFYDTAGVTIAADIVLSDARAVWLARTGRGHDALDAAVHRITGGIGGSGSLKVRGLERRPLDGRVGELELAGVNSWTGSPRVAPEGMGFCAGPGGLIVGTDWSDGGDAIVVFDGPASLPRGNGGATAYLATARRNYGGGDFWHGYLLKGSPAGTVYELPTGMRFVLNRLANNVGLNAVLGSTEGAATLVGSTIAVNVFGTDAGQQWANAAFLTRRGSVLALGAPGKPVTLMPTASGNDAGTVDATTLGDRANNVTLYKRGEGTLVLANVLYRKVDGTTDAGGQFAWQFGRGGAGTDTLATPVFDGAIRSRLGGDGSNSLVDRNIRFNGAVVEFDASASSGATAAWTAALGTGINQVTADGGDYNYEGLGGGFAAFSTGSVSRVIVRLTGYDTAISGWDAIKFGSQPHFFGVNDTGKSPSRDPLMLGSRTANATIEFANHLELSHRNCQIRAIDNPDSTSDRAVVSGRLQTLAEATKTGGLTLAGDGLIEFSCPTNTHRGTFNILGARVLLTGNIARNTSTLPAVTCASGAFGGTGVVERDVTIQAGGTMLAMPPGSPPLEVRGCTLTIAGKVSIDRDQALVAGRWPVARATQGGTIDWAEAVVPDHPGILKGTLSLRGDTLYLSFATPATTLFLR